ncbi:hypothetical protein [Acinetobacter higginsii]|uniref:hypothetical protein n=1 Tax=Acinetobacter higginsii TaxID=70347 RepID=UPI001F620894|nr:hypothetical protein [Acinetobacter higginsii]MCI3878729.1 hypothetical protein [Acinetobacter higginsii]
MKYSVLGLLIGSLLLAGCSGSDNDNNDSSNPPKNNGGSEQPNPKPASTALNDAMSGIALREALLAGLVDTLIAGADEAKDGIKCKTGTITQTGNQIHFDQCSGLYEIAENAKVSGDLDLSNNSYSYKNFTLTFPQTNETQKINGSIKLSSAGNVRTAQAAQITLDAVELDTKGKLIPVNYTFDNYQLVWTSNDATHVQLQISAKLKATGTEFGDFSMAFDNFKTPFNVKKDAEDNLVGYPYDGILTITDLSRSKNIITIKAIGVDQKAQYTAVGDPVFDKQAAWEELLDY